VGQAMNRKRAILIPQAPKARGASAGR